MNERPAAARDMGEGGGRTWGGGRETERERERDVRRNMGLGIEREAKGRGYNRGTRMIEQECREATSR